MAVVSIPLILAYLQCWDGERRDFTDQTDHARARYEREGLGGSRCAARGVVARAARVLDEREDILAFCCVRIIGAEEGSFRD